MLRSSDTPASRPSLPAILPNALRRVGAFAGALAACLAQANPEIQYETLPDLLAAGSAAFARADYPAAAAAFQAIRTSYAEEPAWQSGELPAKLLPLAGYASFKAGQWEDAAAALASYLSEYPDAEALKDLSRFTLALALERKGDADAAISAYAQARQAASSPAVASIAAIQQARVLADRRQADAALEALDSALAQSAPGSRARVQARLASIRIALDHERLDTARAFLLDAPWSAAEMPELATLSFLALEAGDLLLERDQPADALRAYRLVWPRDALARRQRERLDALVALYRERAPSLELGQRIWADFYQQIIARLTSQLAALEAAEDYEPALLYRKARCLVQLERPAEAWLVLEKLSLSGDPSAAMPAHREWIHLAQSMQAWRTAATLARRYLDLYPNDSDTTAILRAIGSSLLELQDYAAALPAFEAALQAASKNADRAVASYYAGFCLAMLQRYEAARAAFQHACDAAPSTSLAGQATLWIGIAHYLEDAFDEAIAVFERVQSNPDWPLAAAEAGFRKAVCEYASDRLDDAERSLESFLAEGPDHPRAAEAYSLLGDISFDRGEWRKAIGAYARISSEDREIACHAALKTAECLIELGAPAEALAALARFAESPVPPQRVGAFYRFWAQTLHGAGMRKQAAAILANAIAARGPDIDAEGIPDLVRLRLAIDPAAPDPKTQAADAPPALAARLLLSAAQEESARGRKHEAETLALRLASEFALEALPPECLAAAGLALVEIGSHDGAACLDRILALYPTSQYINDARFGLAKLERERGYPEAALLHMESFDPLAADPEVAPLALALKAELLVETGQHAKAAEAYADLLAQRALRPSAKASALVGLGNALWRGGDPQRAYACFERVFTLYRGEQPFVADSYLHCARILKQLGEDDQAQAVCREFLDQADLVSYPAYAQAETLRDSLAAMP